MRGELGFLGGRTKLLTCFSFPGGSVVKNLPADAGDLGLIPRGQEDLLKKERATPSSILAWKIPWTEETVGYSPWSHKLLDTSD